MCTCLKQAALIKIQLLDLFNVLYPIYFRSRHTQSPWSGRTLATGSGVGSSSPVADDACAIAGEVWERVMDLKLDAGPIWAAVDCESLGVGEDR
jgi:hypothetical protein